MLVAVAVATHAAKEARLEVLTGSHQLALLTSSVPVLEPLFFDLIEDIPHGKGRAKDGLPHCRHALGMQGIRTAVRDHVSIGRDRPEQTVELVDLVDGDSENEAIVRHGVPAPVISRTQPSA